MKRQIHLCLSGGSVRSIIASSALCRVFSEFDLWDKITHIEGVSGSGILVSSLIHWKRKYPNQNFNEIINSLTLRIVRRFSNFSNIADIEDDQLNESKQSFPKTYGRIIANIIIGKDDMLVGDGSLYKHQDYQSNCNNPELIVCAVSGLLNRKVDLLSLLTKQVKTSDRLIDYRGWVEFKEDCNEIIARKDPYSGKSKDKIRLTSVEISRLMGITGNVFWRKDLTNINILIKVLVGTESMIPKKLINKINEISYMKDVEVVSNYYCPKQFYPCLDSGFHLNIPYISVTERLKKSWYKNYNQKIPNSIYKSDIAVILDNSINRSGLLAVYKDCAKNKSPFPFKEVEKFLENFDNNPNSSFIKIFRPHNEDKNFVSNKYYAIPTIIYITLPEGCNYSSLKMNFNEYDFEKFLRGFRRLMKNLDLSIFKN